MRLALALAGVVVASALPFLFALELGPVTRDGTLWLVEGRARAGWSEWVLGSPHFVGYRPTAAASYGLLDVLGGGHVEVQRAFDLLLPALTALLVHALQRRLLPGSSPWGGVLAALLFVVHPVVGEVTPFLARRSNALATLFSTAACVVLLPPRAGMGTSPGRALAASTCLLLALTSNEVAYGIVPVLCGLAFLVARGGGTAAPERGHGPSSHGSPWTSILAFVGATAVAFAARVQVLGGVGGYGAALDPGSAAGAPGASPMEILARSAEALLGLASLDAGARAAPAVVAVAFGGALALLGITLVQPWSRELRGAGSAHHQRGAWVSTLLWGSLLAHALVLAPFGVWFPRQVHPMLVPLALLLSLGLGRALDRGGRERRGVVAAAGLALVPSMATLWLLAQAPLLDPLRGAWPVTWIPDSAALRRERASAWRAQDGMLRDLVGRVTGIQGPARVELAVPLFTRPGVAAHRARGDGTESGGARRVPHAARQPELWARSRAPQDVELRTRLVFRHLVGQAGARVRAEGRRVVFEHDGEVVVLDPRLAVEATETGTRAVLGARDSTHVYAHDGAEGRLVELPARDRGRSE